MIRCFIAIELSKEIKDALAQVEDEFKKTISGVKWLKPDNIHLTLKFLGNVEEENIEKVKDVLAQTASQAGPFKIKLSSPGAFPGPGNPRVIWIGIEEGKNETSSLVNILESELAPLGIEKKSRAFHPHLTLARVKFLKDKNSLKNALTRIQVPQTEMTASKITLFQSTLTREGAVYTALCEAGLKNG